MGLLARQTINCERISVGVGRWRRRWGRMRGNARRGRARGILPRLFFIRVLARAVSRLFLILHRGRECFTLRPRPSRLPSLLFYPALRPSAFLPLRPPHSMLSVRKPRYRASRNEFTILIWRAALAIYYLHGVAEKKKRGMRRRRRRWKEDKRQREVGNWRRG